MTMQTPGYVDAAESIVNTPGSRDFDVDTAWAHIGRRTLLTVGARNLLYSRADAYVKFEAGTGRARCWVVVKLDPTDEYSVEFHRVDNRLFRKVKGERVMNENFGRVKILDLFERIPLENLREIIVSRFAA
jgi:Ni,Fe-hydrogenase III component G